MKTRIVASGLVGGLVILSLVSAAPVPHDAKADQKQVEQSYRDFLKATERRDEQTLRRLMSDRYARQNASGGRLGLVDRDAEIKLSLAVDDWRAEVKEIEVRVHGGAAVVYAVYRIKGEQGGVRLDLLMRANATFARKDGGWVLVADHPELIPEE